MSLSELLKYAASAAVGVTDNNEDCVTIVTSTKGVVWNEMVSFMFAADAGVLRSDYQRPWGYVRRTPQGWECLTWQNNRRGFCFSGASDADLVEFLGHMPVCIILVEMNAVDTVSQALLQSGRHRRVHGVKQNAVIHSS